MLHSANWPFTANLTHNSTMHSETDLFAGCTKTQFNTGCCRKKTWTTRKLWKFRLQWRLLILMQRFKDATIHRVSHPPPLPTSTDRKSCYCCVKKGHTSPACRSKMKGLPQVQKSRPLENHGQRKPKWNSSCAARNTIRWVSFSIKRSSNQWWGVSSVPDAVRQLTSTNHNSTVYKW